MTPLSVPETDGDGIWPSQWLLKAVESGVVIAPEFDEVQLQPASLDLTLGTEAHRLRCSFLPGKNDSVEDAVKAFSVGPPIPLDEGAILERNRPYLIRLRESLALPPTLRARTNPKSSTGRVDVFTRVITDRCGQFDDVKPGYSGPLYLEVVPRSFAVTVRAGLALNQLRLISGDTHVDDDAIRAEHKKWPIVYLNGEPADRREVRADGGLWLSLDLKKRDDAAVGYRAKHNSNLVDLSLVDHYETADYWEPVVPEVGNRVVLEPEAFYLLLSNEAIRVPPEYAVEMVAFDPSGGEVRTHYAGFFDPGFGHDPSRFFSEGSRAALEIRAHDVPFAVDHLQRVCSLRFERMLEVPTLLYGAQRGSHYQGQLSTVSKHFRFAGRPDQETFRRAATRGPATVEFESGPSPRVEPAPEQTRLDEV